MFIFLIIISFKITIKKSLELEEIKRVKTITLKVNITLTNKKLTTINELLNKINVIKKKKFKVSNNKINLNTFILYKNNTVTAVKTISNNFICN